MVKKRVLHISHHIGCFRDQEYVLNRLGFEVTNYKFTDNVFTVTKDIADEFWHTNRDIINSFDYVLVSDTSALSRPFLEHIDELVPKLIVWICNRFDFAMQGDDTFYHLFKSHKQYTNVRIVASTFFEKMWCLWNGIDILDSEVINPIGKSPFSEINIPNSDVYENWYGTYSSPELPNADFIVPIYTNDNKFFKMADFIRTMGYTVYNGNYSRVEDLTKYSAYVTLPDTFCKWFSFEAVQQNIPVVLPSVRLLETLASQNNYLFNVTGYGQLGKLTSDMIRLSEWYKPEFVTCRCYFDEFDHIPLLLDQLRGVKFDFSAAALQHEEKTLHQWKAVYDSF